jgi:hypothetical protein
MQQDARYWISRLNLTPHPEGGYFRETYRAAEEIAPDGLPPRFDKARAFSTAIYFLLESGDFSALHRLRSDEMWHFYGGSCLAIHIIDRAGRYRLAPLGADLETGQSLQVMVEAGCWFGATVTQPDSWTLAGCTVAPGFDFSDFELARRAVLLERHPGHRVLIERLTRA